RDEVADDPRRASLVTEALAELTRILKDDTDVVLFKGGVTAAVGLRAGLGAQLAIVEGPVRPGVAIWRLENGRRCLVFPGNVGSDDTLAEVCSEILS
ncbi:MAG: nucleotide-binding domain containing protein, partial [Gaiellaceae bacterium]